MVNTLQYIPYPNKLEVSAIHLGIFDIKYIGVTVYLAITATVLALFGLYYIIEKHYCY